MKHPLNRFMKVILFTLSAFLFLVVAGIGGTYIYVRGHIYESQLHTKAPSVIPLEDEAPSTDMHPIQEPEPVYEEQQGITNILLVGTDARKLDESARSDTMMIVTIDSIHKKLKLTSLMRDSFVTIKGHSDQKLNAAFAYGGPSLLFDTIQRNFKIKLDKYIIINFWGFKEIVDAIGGLDIDIKDYEIREINKYINIYYDEDSVSFRKFGDKKSSLLTHAGQQHLDGQQALSYARIRHVGSGSFERNERQRKVLSLIVDRLKDTNILQYPYVLSKILPHVKTNIEPAALMNYAFTISKYKPLQIAQLQLPVEGLCDGRIYKGSWVLLMDKQQNAEILHDFTFHDTSPLKKNLDIKAFQRVLAEYLKNDYEAVFPKYKPDSLHNMEMNKSTTKRKVPIPKQRKEISKNRYINSSLKNSIGKKTSSKDRDLGGKEWDEDSIEED